jgi:hypothetical protein
VARVTSVVAQYDRLGVVVGVDIDDPFKPKLPIPPPSTTST